jgi:hypothetical protein
VTPNSNGFTVNFASGGGQLTNGGINYASWTFREQPKFFDIVTWSGDSTSGRQISHNLGATPGMVIVKSLATDQWTTWHRSLTSGNYIVLNSTAAQTTAGAVNRFGNGTTTVNPTDTVFTVGSNGEVNQTGNNYVAYLFAHDAGGFGTSGNDNVISCGSFTTDGSGNATVSLGYEPQWVLIKQTDGVDSWYLNDNMRGMAVSGNQPNLSPNSSAAESAGGYNTYPNATGFTASVGIAAKNYIYIAIRRGPMAVPTDGTSVFAIDTRYSAGSNPAYRANFPVDMDLVRTIDGTSSWSLQDRLRGKLRLITNSTDAESAWDERYDFNNGWGEATSADPTRFSWMFGRAPGFFDVVCYTGTGSARTIAHNLASVPQLIIVKGRSNALNWRTYNFFNGSSQSMNLNDDGRSSDVGNIFWNSTTPTASVFSIGTDNSVNASGQTFVAYLFASAPGVSKVGNYTGTGTTQVINCGFTAGARFVLIKRTNVEGDWYVWDSARGIVAGNDPYLLLNSTAAEVTSTDYIDTAATGFEISSTAPAAINANGGSFIFLAIA